MRALSFTRSAGSGVRLLLLLLGDALRHGAYEEKLCSKLASRGVAEQWEMFVHTLPPRS